MDLAKSNDNIGIRCVSRLSVYAGNVTGLRGSNTLAAWPRAEALDRRRGMPLAGACRKRRVVELASNYGFNVHELNDIQGIIEQHQIQLIEAWYEYFDQD